MQSGKPECKWPTDWERPFADSEPSRTIEDEVKEDSHVELYKEIRESDVHKEREDKKEGKKENAKDDQRERKSLHERQKNYDEARKRIFAD